MCTLEKNFFLAAPGSMQELSSQPPASGSAVLATLLPGNSQVMYILKKHNVIAHLVAYRIV